MSESAKSFTLQVMGSVASQSSRDRSIKVTHSAWSEAEDEAKVTIVKVDISTEATRNDTEGDSPNNPDAKTDPGDFIRVGGSIDVTLKYEPEDLDRGVLSISGAEPTGEGKEGDEEGDQVVRLTDSDGLETTSWDLTEYQYGGTIDLTAEGIKPGDITVTFTHSPTGAEDQLKLNVYRMTLDLEKSVFDPKLGGAATYYAKQEGSAEFDFAVFKGTTRVCTISPSDDYNTGEWGGKWDVDPNKGKFANPDNYTIKHLAYRTAEDKKNKRNPLPSAAGDSADVYLVRLGVEKIEFEGTTHIPMQFHTTSANLNSGTSTLSGVYVPWQLSNNGTNLNIDSSDGKSALKEDAKYAETFFPKATGAEHRNYPICYVQKSKITMKTVPSNNYVSEISGTASTGTIPAGTPDVYMKVTPTIGAAGTIKTTPGKISPGTAVTLNFDEELEEGVGNQELQFEFEWFYKSGTKEIPIKGSFASSHKCYRTVGAPNAPWNTTTSAPWVAAMDYATTWANGKKDEDSVADAVTKTINADLGLEYDTGHGRPNYQTGNNLRISNLMLYIKNGTADSSRLLSLGTRPSKIVNCADCGALVTAFGNILGTNLRKTHIDTPHALNEINAIGSVGSPFPSFSFHAFASKERTNSSGAKVKDSIWDACLEVGRPDPVHGRTTWEIPCNMDHKLTEPAYAEKVTSNTKGGTILKINLGGNKGYLEVTKVWQEANHHGNVISTGPNVYTATCTKVKSGANSSEFQLTCARIAGFTPIIVTGDNANKICSYRGCNLLTVKIKEGTTPFVVGDKFEFRTEYDYSEYRSSLAAPDWTLGTPKGRTPASTLVIYPLTIN